MMDSGLFLQKVSTLQVVIEQVHLGSGTGTFGKMQLSHGVPYPHCTEECPAGAGLEELEEL